MNWWSSKQEKAEGHYNHSSDESTDGYVVFSKFLCCWQQFVE